MSIYIHDGTAWNEINDLGRYAGGEWQSAELSRYNGTGWELLWPCHFEYTRQYSLMDYAVFADAGENEVNPGYLTVGNKSAATNTDYSDTLMLFPVEQMRQDIGSGQVISASLTLTRRSKDQGEDTAYVTVGHALSGVDFSVSGNTWDREFTLLRSNYVSFAQGKTKSISLDASGITALLNGTSDCLCLPSTGIYTFNPAGYAQFEPDSTVLSVTYLS